MKNEKGATLHCILGVSMLAFAVIIFYGCGGDDGAGPDPQKVYCTAGCNSMNWSLEGESGEIYQEASCSLNWIGNNYIETCHGSRTYTATGNTYEFSVVYDWIDCSISVTVTGVGSCTDG